MHDPCNTSPGTRVTADSAFGLFKPARSSLLVSPGHQLTSPEGGSMHVDEAAPALSGRDTVAINNINAAICRDFCFTNYKASFRDKSPHGIDEVRREIEPPVPPGSARRCKLDEGAHLRPRKEETT